MDRVLPFSHVLHPRLFCFGEFATSLCGPCFACFFASRRHFFFSLWFPGSLFLCPDFFPRAFLSAGVSFFHLRKYNEQGLFRLTT